jgi:hypothetical protein
MVLGLVRIRLKAAVDLLLRANQQADLRPGGAG